MTESTTPARPPQVTMAGWVTVGASVLMLVSVFTFVGNLRSLDTREGVQDALDREPLSGTGLGLERALDLMHGAALVAGACAAAAAILGWFVMQRNHQARIALSIIAVPLLLTGMVAAGFLASMVAVSVVLLWAKPARDWFNGVTPEPPQRQEPPRPEPPRTTEQAGPERPVDPGTPPASSGPRAFEGFGSRPTAPPAYGATRTPYAVQSTRPSGAARPREVVQACVTTWVVCGVVLMGMLIALVGFVAMPDLVQEVYDSDSRFADAGVSVDALRRAAAFVAAAFAVWAALALLLAWFVFAGHNWARITLIVSASLSALISLLMVISSPALLLVTVTSVVVIVALTRAPAVAWFTRAGRQQPDAGHPPR